MNAVDDYLAGIPLERQQRIIHLMDVVQTANPGLPCRMWDYGGGVIGYGHYRYRYVTGREGSFFMLGIGNRKRYVAIYSNAVFGTEYLAETFADRLPGCKIGKSCIELPDRISIDDQIVVELARRTVEYFRSEFERPKSPKSLQLWEGDTQA